MKKLKRDLLIGAGTSLLFNITALLMLPGLIVVLFSFFGGSSLSEGGNVTRITPPDTVSVFITSSGTVSEIDFEEYVKGVVAAEMPSSFEEEALKAQAVAARTYSLSKVIRSGDGGFPAAHPLAPLCDDVHCQAYLSPEQLADIKGEEWMDTGYVKVCAAVDDTRGELMYYEGELAHQALFHSSSGGRTENSEDVFASAVPYLRSVESPYEEDATHREDRLAFSLLDLAARLNSAYRDRFTGNFTASDILVTERTDGGRVEAFQVGSAVYTGREVREALGLSSANFSVAASSDGETVTFTTTGYGHGVGMSQYGANGMAKDGSDYKEILTHYYTGVRVL